MQATIYRVHSGFGNVCDGLTVDRPRGDVVYDEEIYDLPDGFSVDVDLYGEMYIRAPSGAEATPCLRNNRPNAAVYLIYDHGKIVFLKKAASSEKHIPLRDARIAAGITQKQLADASGVNVRQIQRVEIGESEAGNLTAKNLLAIADALGVEPRTLIGG